jgi:hypothetical protein
MGEKRTACRVSEGKYESKSSLGRPRGMWKNNVTTGLTEKRWGGVEWIHVAEEMET